MNCYSAWYLYYKVINNIWILLIFLGMLKYAIIEYLNLNVYIIKSIGMQSVDLICLFLVLVLIRKTIIFNNNVYLMVILGPWCRL